MSIRHTITLSALAAAIILLQGCASAPKTAEGPAEQLSESNEPDLVAQLRARMAAGTLQRQEKADSRKPSEASGDTSRSPGVSAITALPPVPVDVAGDYAKAIELMSSGQDDEAQRLLQSVASRSPQFSGPLVNQALILLRQKEYAKAQAMLDAALGINARNPYAFNIKGIALREQGKFAEARRAYEDALAIDPGYAKAHFNLGVLADLYLQDLPLALTHYERYQSLQSKPDPAVANWIIDLQKRTGVYKAPPPAPTPKEPEPEPIAAATAAETATEPGSSTPDDPPAESHASGPTASPDAAPGTTAE